MIHVWLFGKGVSGMTSSSQLFVFIVFVIACTLMSGISFTFRNREVQARSLLLEVSMWGSGLIASVCVPELIFQYLRLKC